MPQPPNNSPYFRASPLSAQYFQPLSTKPHRKNPDHQIFSEMTAKVIFKIIFGQEHAHMEKLRAKDKPRAAVKST